MAVLSFIDEGCVVQKVTLEDVLNAAMTESKTFVVIYASERAIAESVRPLPDSLEVSQITQLLLSILIS